MLTKEVREQDANVVVTRRHVYEMKDNGTKEGVVSRLFMETDKTENDVWLKATEMVKKLCCDTDGSMLFIDEKTHRFTLKGDFDIFSQKSAHDQYLKFLEEKTGVRCCTKSIKATKNVASRDCDKKFTLPDTRPHHRSNPATFWTFLGCRKRSRCPPRLSSAMRWPFR